MARLVNDIRARLYLDEEWRDISSDVRYEQGITIRRGYGAEDEVAPPSTCKLTLDNRSGDYTERNPLGQWYSHLGRSTPFELACRIVKDTATTNASNGWGSTDAHAEGAWSVLAWTNAGGVAGDFNKSGGKATHLISTANDSRFSWLAGFSQRDTDWAVTFSLGFTNVTGDALGADFFARGTGAIIAYYAARVLIHTDESITIDIVDINGASLTLSGPTTTGLTHSSSQALRHRMQVEGRTVRAKVWAASGTEPFEWQTSYTDEGADASVAAVTDAAGFIGIRSVVGASNTNVPVTFSYDDVEAFTPEFAGEVAAWPRSRDTTGNERTVSITAADVTRRLSTGDSPLDSALRREIIRPSFNLPPPPIVYWPLEDGEFAVADKVQSPVGGGHLGFVLPNAGTEVGKVTWAADRTLPGGSQAPALTGGGSLIGWLSPVSSAAEWVCTWGMKQSYTDGAFMMLVTASSHITLTLLRNPSTLAFDIGLSLDGGGTSTIMTHTFPDKNDVEEWHQFVVAAAQNGADVDFSFEVDGLTVDVYTETTDTLDGLRRVQLSSVTNAASNTYFAHVAVNEVYIPGASYAAFRGNAGELALDRAERLCSEEGIHFGWLGSGVTFGTPNTEPMGAQRSDGLLKLIQSCAKVDNGLLYTQRTVNGFQFRTLETMYSRTPWCELSLSGGHFSPPWGATSDDQALRNDITANRDGGGSVRYQLDDDSRMSVTSAADGGAGRYDSSASVNVASDTQLLSQAQWRVHLGTTDEDRFPALQLQLSRAVFRDTAGLALSAKLRDLDIGDLIALTDMGSEDIYDDLDQLVVGIGKYLDQFTYDMTLTCRPGSSYRVFTLDSSFLDDEDTTLNEALDTTETGVDITVATTGRIWSAADQPYDVATGGERMTLTALSGSGPSQTFTVTRSANGVVKSHSTGQPIRLARPDYLGK
jgi:hypothetical protein